MAIPVDLERDEAAMAAEYAARDHSETTLAARALSVVGGIFATLVFLLFLFLSELYESGLVTTVLGFSLIGGSFLLARERREAFLATITVCAYLLGVSLLLLGLGEGWLDDGQLIIPLLIVAVITLIVTTNYFLILLATVAIPYALLWLHLELHRPFLVGVATLVSLAGWLYVSFSEAKLIRNKRYFPLRTGLLLGFGLCLLWFRWGFEFERVGPGEGMRVILSLLTIVGSLLVLLVSFHHAHRIGIGLGVAGLLYFTGQLYYDLSWTLLNKSVFMMVSGVVFLVLYYFVNRKYFAGESP